MARFEPTLTLELCEKPYQFAFSLRVQTCAAYQHVIYCSVSSRIVKLFLHKSEPSGLAPSSLVKALP